jgi:diaminopimelate decarboxylase
MLSLRETMTPIDALKFLTPDEVLQIRAQYGSPVYVYDERTLRQQAHSALQFAHPFGLTVRYAIKANPNAAILQLFDGIGLHFDASSGFEAHRAMRAGIAPDKISLSTQQMPDDALELANQGVLFVATSLNQLERWGEQNPGSQISLRFNPGIGSGGNNRTNVGGPQASFGIWHEWHRQVTELLSRYDLSLVRIHTHIGSGTDPEIWSDAARRSLAMVERFGTVNTLDLGGGFKAARMPGEVETDLQEVGSSVRAALLEFAERTGREIALEIEPGTVLVANAGALVATVTDVVSTGSTGHEFLRTDTGLTEILRPAMYGAQHPIVVVRVGGTTDERGEYVVVGHCCETGDILSPAIGDPETVARRRLQKASAADAIVLEGVGAYCAAMSATNYNSFPTAPEVLRRGDGSYRLIRRRQSLEEMVALEE